MRHPGGDVDGDAPVVTVDDRAAGRARGLDPVVRLVDDVPRARPDQLREVVLVPRDRGRSDVLPVVGQHARADRFVTHGKDGGVDGEPVGDVSNCLGESHATVHEPAAEQVQPDVHVAEREPCRLAEPVQHGECVEGVVGDTEPRALVEHARESIQDRIDVRAHQETPEFVVVCRVRDDGQLTRREQPREAGSELGAAGAPGEQRESHRKRSSSRRRMSSCPLPERLAHGSRPRTITAGTRRVFPMTSPAAAAISVIGRSLASCAISSEEGGVSVGTGPFYTPRPCWAS